MPSTGARRGRRASGLLWGGGPGRRVSAQGAEEHSGGRARAERQRQRARLRAERAWGLESLWAVARRPKGTPAGLRVGGGCGGPGSRGPAEGVHSLDLEQKGVLSTPTQRLPVCLPVFLCLSVRVHISVSLCACVCLCVRLCVCVCLSMWSWAVLCPQPHLTGRSPGPQRAGRGGDGAQPLPWAPAVRRSHPCLHHSQGPRPVTPSLRASVSSSGKWEQPTSVEHTAQAWPCSPQRTSAAVVTILRNHDTRKSASARLRGLSQRGIRGDGTDAAHTPRRSADASLPLAVRPSLPALCTPFRGDRGSGPQGPEDTVHSSCSVKTCSCHGLEGGPGRARPQPGPVCVCGGDCVPPRPLPQTAEPHFLLSTSRRSEA